MLELPEALTQARQLNAAVKGRTIVAVEANHSPHGFAFFWGDPAGYPDMLEGLTIGGAAPRGGMVELSAGEMRLVLGDGAAMRLVPAGGRRPEKHQLRVELDDGCALFCTIRMYGGMWAFPAGANDNPYYLVAGEKPSPLSEEFDRVYFDRLWEEAEGKLSAKAFLATGQRIPGLGNGCLQDILHRAGVHPRRKLDTLSREDRRGLFEAIKSTLREMAEQGGRDTERDLFGRAGGYRTALSAKTWKGVCPRCGGPITRQAYLGGNVYFCTKCQPL